MKNRKLRTSKIIMWLFTALFLYVVYQGVNYDFTSVSYMDTAIFCSCIASVGGILGAVVTRYFNNSCSENIPRIQLDLYKESMQLRLQYNEKMMELRKKYQISPEELCEIENESNMDEISEGILNTAISELDIKAAESHENVEVQIY